MFETVTSLPDTALKTAINRSIEEQEAIEDLNVVMEVLGVREELLITICGKEATLTAAVVV